MALPDRFCVIMKAYSYGPAERWTLTEYIRLVSMPWAWAICSERDGSRDELELKAAVAGFTIMSPKTEIWYPRVWLGANEISGELEPAK